MKIRLAPVAAFLLVAASLSTGRAGTFTKYIDSSALPNNASITDVSTDGSAIAFDASIINSDGTSNSAIYYVGGPGASPVKLVDLTTMSPSGGGAFTSLGNPIVSGSTVIFQGRVQTNAVQNNGIYIAQVGGSLSVAVDTNTTNLLDPTGSLTGNSKLGGFAGYDLNGNNIIFTANSEEGFPGDVNVFKTTTSGGTPTPLLAFQPNTPAGIPFYSFQAVKLVGSTYAVGGTDQNSKNGLYTGSLDGGPVRLVIDSTTAEPTGQGNFVASYLQQGLFALTSDASNVVFAGDVATATGGVQVSGLYSAPSAGGGVSAAVLVGAPKPDGGTFGAAFFGLHTEGSVGLDFVDSTLTVYATGIDGGGIVRLIGSGDVLDGQTVSIHGGILDGTGPSFGLAVVTQSDTGTYAAYVASASGTSYETPSFFANEVSLGNGVDYLTFPNGNPFGYYSFLADPHYVFHFDLGYEYVFDAADGKSGVYLYDFASQDFFYTSPVFPFPYLYDFNLNTVLYYYPDPNNPGRYNTNGVRYFFDFNTGQIITK